MQGEMTNWDLYKIHKCVWPLTVNQQSYTNLFSSQWRWQVWYLIFQVFYTISHANWKRSTLVEETAQNQPQIDAK